MVEPKAIIMECACCLVIEETWGLDRWLRMPCNCNMMCAEEASQCAEPMGNPFCVILDYQHYWSINASGMIITEEIMIDISELVLRGNFKVNWFSNNLTGFEVCVARLMLEESENTARLRFWIFSNGNKDMGSTLSK